jgi:glycosyltransferase involved in cell wall biosynthesis
VKVPFIRGGAEVLADSLLEALLAQGHEADLVAIPYKHYPPERILDHMLACRLLDLTEAFGKSIDRLIALKFPAYLIHHPNKVLWLLHQHRQAYDMWEHPLGDLAPTPNGSVIRDAIRHADSSLIPEAKAIFTLSSNVSRRLKKDCGIDSTPLYNPPANAESFYCSDDPSDYLFYPSRINALKRQTAILRALAHTRWPVRVLFAGAADNPLAQRECDTLVRELRLDGRAHFLGQVTEKQKFQLYAESRGVLFIPGDEDYGYITLEAMLSRKPVLTCTDSGGPLEFVVHEQTGLVVDPTPEALAEAMDQLWADPDRRRRWGQAGRKRYEEMEISWERVVTRLLA